MKASKTIRYVISWVPAVLACAFPCITEAKDAPWTPPAPSQSAALNLDDLLRLSLEQNPGLRQAGLDVDAARGRAVQAGLYPNPTLSVQGEEIGRRSGIYTVPLVSQEIVTAGKLTLSQAAAEKQVDQAALAFQEQRAALFARVRQGYYELLILQRRIEVLNELVMLASKSAENAETMHMAQLITELDVLQFRVELDRLRADLSASQRERTAAADRLAAVIGIPTLGSPQLLGSLDDPLPDYDYEKAQAFVTQEHPAVKAAVVGIRRAELLLKRQEAEPISNVTAGVGYQWNVNERESQAIVQVSVPLPIWNKNQGNIAAAQAEFGRAREEVARVQSDLANRLAVAYGQYAAARERADRYRTAVLPNARRAYQLSQEAFKGGQFEYLRVIQAQRSVAEANLEYIRVLGIAWQAASELSGLLLQDCMLASSVGVVVPVTAPTGAPHPAGK